MTGLSREYRTGKRGDDGAVPGMPGRENMTGLYKEINGKTGRWKNE